MIPAGIGRITHLLRATLFLKEVEEMVDECGADSNGLKDYSRLVILHYFLDFSRQLMLQVQLFGGF